jgi:flavin reductase (DIM6/NTAB) family NADH-FMN oxidoreductase RutF
MHIELAGLSPNQIYFHMIQTLIPRPIAWVLSANEGGSFNLAPFSYFNAVSSDPPLIMLSIGKKPDGSHKDTRVNIEQRGDFVIHIPHQGQAQDVTESSATLAAGDSELDRLGLETAGIEGFPLPRLADCRVAYACQRYEIREIGGTPQSLILGLVRSIYLDESVVREDAKGRVKVDAKAVDPLARLGASQYLTAGEVLRIPRPR